MLGVPVNADPRVLGAFWVQGEEERLAGAEISLPLALVILQVALEPPG